ncbi:polysaccharide pyruvyl transferase family protein [Bacillus gobiensis]|uniref:polysaccharide pyruvyl transferase family protein n=1 Tax=Bacillus gobiensis TaxID=1441095 RepID=UPI003D255351
MRIVLWGYYGTNYGDNIMMDTIVKFLISNDVKITLVDLFKGNLKEMYKDEPRIEVVEFYRLGKVKKLMALRNFAKAELNLWGGGTIFTDEDGDGNYSFFSLVKLFGGKIGYIGVGIGNLTKQERVKRTRYLLNASSFLVFRDSTSLSRAKAISDKNTYHLAEDLSYLFFETVAKDTEQPAHPEPYMLITWRNLKRYVPAEREQSSMKAVVACAKHDLDNNIIQKVVLSPMDTRHDIESCQMLMKLLDEESIPYAYDDSTDFEYMTKLIKHATIHYSGRLHGSVASEYFGINTVAMCYSPKMEYFYQSIKADNYINITEEGVTPDALMKKVGRNSISFDEKIASSYNNITYFDNFLKQKIIGGQAI